MEYIRVVMINDRLDEIPELPTPNGYAFRTFNQGEQSTWAEIETAAGEFQDTESAVSHFNEEFGDHVHEMTDRCFFLLAPEGGAVGTATAWYDTDFQGKEYGRLHWVGIHPRYQGRGLGKPLVGRALRRLAQSHSRAYLTSQTTSFVALKIYLDFGFVPLMSVPRSMEAWTMVDDMLHHPKLEEYL